MSDILQKSLAALPGLLSASLGGATGDGSLTTGIQSFVRNLIELNSNHEEQEMIQRELTLQKQKLSLPSLTTAQTRDCLLRLMVCHMLGYDVSFCYIHAVKLAQQGAILEKRVGYVACSLFIRNDHELAMLLINTIHRDLSSTNILEVCSALVAACQLVSSDLIPALLLPVTDRLTHAKEIVRRKAVLCLHSFVRKVPDLTSQIHSLIRRSLTDRDPGVVWAAVEVYQRLVRINVESCRDIVPAVVDILSQVTSRRLPTLFDYHTVPSPWFTISLLKLLTALAADSQSASALAWPVLGDILQRTEPSHKAGLAVIYETLLTIASIQPDQSLLALATKCISRFLSSKTVNLQYIGMKVLASIVKVDARYALEHQAVVIECLEHSDPTIQAKTLDVLFHMANTVNKDAICACLLDHLSRTSDRHMKLIITARIVEIINRLSDDTEWYITKMSEVMQTRGDLVPAYCVQKLVTTIKNGLSSSSTLVDSQQRRLFAVNMYWRLLQSTECINEGLQRVAVWTLGEYCRADEQIPANDVTHCLSVCYSRPNCSDVTRQWIVSALVKLLPYATNFEAVIETLTENSSSIGRETKQRLNELKYLCSSPLKDKILRTERTPIEKMDFTLSFLDSFVSDALEAGAQPFKPRNLHVNRLEEFRRSSGSNLIVAPYENVVLPPRPGSRHALSSMFNSASLASGPGSSAGSTGRDTASESEGAILSKAVKQVWGRDGLLIHKEKPEILKSLALNWDDSATAASKTSVSGSTRSAASSDEMTDTSGRNSLAAALFGGIQQHEDTADSLNLLPVSASSALAPHSLPQADEPSREITANNIPSPGTELCRSRSMTPDSIESREKEDDTECKHDSQNQMKHYPLLSDDLSGIYTASETELSSRSGSEILTVQNESCRQFSNNNSDSSLAPSWTKDGFRTARLDECLSLDAGFTCNLVASPTETLLPTSGIFSPSDSDANLLVDGLCTSVSDDVKSELPSSVLDAGCSSSDGRLAATRSDGTQLFDGCRLFSVTYSKIFATDCLRIVLCISRKSYANLDDFDSASMTVVSSDGYVVKVVDCESETENVISLNGLVLDGSLTVHVSVFPANVNSLCETDSCRHHVAVRLSAVNVSEQCIDLCLLDFVRPCELSLESFADSWCACENEVKAKVTSSASVTQPGPLVDVLKSAGHLHVIKIAESEVILCGRVLNQQCHFILVHCRLSSSDKICDIWVKSPLEKVLLARFTSDISALISDGIVRVENFT